MVVVGWQLGMSLGVSKLGESGWFRPSNYLFNSRSKFNKSPLLFVIIIPRSRVLRDIPILKHLVMEHKGQSLYQEEAEGVGLHGIIIPLNSIVNMVRPPTRN